PKAGEVTYKDEPLRILKVRNPRGSQEWNGAWSDGLKEWTAQMMKELNHTFGDDGIFWISYKDFLRYYPELDRIRLFGPEWTVTQQFTFSIDKAGQTVLVLSQPDNRYFGGMRGLYRLQLHFRLYKDGQDTYLLRSMEDTGSTRACSAELDPEAVSYSILVKITAYRVDNFATARVQLFPSVQLLLLLSDAYGERLEVPARDEVQRSWFARHIEGIGEIANVEHARGRAKEKSRMEMVREREARRKERMLDKLKNKRIKEEEEKRKRAEARKAKRAARREKSKNDVIVGINMTAPNPAGKPTLAAYSSALSFPPEPTKTPGASSRDPDAARQNQK
ncbi:hypothetical protein LTS18_007808, partial [Coniosporium uncinatum]